MNYGGEMNSYKKYIFFLILSVVFFQCVVSNRLREPKDDLEKKNQGIVAFGLLFHDPDNSSLLSGNKGTFYFPDSVDYFVVNAVNEKEKTVSAGQFIDLEPEVVSEGMKKYSYTSQGKIGNYFLFRTYNPKVKYAINEITYRVQCGDNCGKTINFRLPPYYSQKALNFSAPAGKIAFLGIFQIKKVILKDGGILNVGEESGYVIEDGLDFVLKRDSFGLSKKFFGNEEKSVKGAEIHFLKNLIQNQIKGHWVDVAKTRLDVLEGKVSPKTK